ncbi:MAG: hypothetical protein KJZ92_17780 [Rhodocyclaceae bacterium]|nr:hypothetical protein [Rhodocyclaceae bacterium]
MRQRFSELWRIGWWMLPVMAVMSSPWVPGVGALWGDHLSAAKEAMQIIAPVLALLIIGASTATRTKPDGSN